VAATITGVRLAFRLPNLVYVDRNDLVDLELWHRLERGESTVLQIDVEGSTAREDVTKRGVVTRSVRLTIGQVIEVEEFAPITFRPKVGAT
jgi:hypothetical protein